MGNNKIGKILKITGALIIILGIILGFILGYNHYSFLNLKLALTFWGTGFVFGFSFLGLSEIIILLQTLVDKQK